MKTLKLLCIIAIILLQSCDKDSSPCRNSETNIYYNIADSNKVKIPYSGTETLVFISDQGDTATLVGQGKKTYYVTNTRNNSGNADCQWLENKNYENVDLVFIDQKNKTQNLRIRVFPEVLFDNLILSSLDIFTSNTLIIGRSFKYIDNKSIEDSMFVNGSYLKGVYLDSEKTTLFNYSQGVLKYKDLNNHKWTLNQIK